MRIIRATQRRNAKAAAKAKAQAKRRAMELKRAHRRKIEFNNRRALAAKKAKAHRVHLARTRRSLAARKRAEMQARKRKIAAMKRMHARRMAAALAARKRRVSVPRIMIDPPHRVMIKRKCAREHQRGEAGICRCKGTIHYGAKGKFAKKRSNGKAMKCSNGVFGDPIRGTVKDCFC
jgi:hypothetical protein